MQLRLLLGNALLGAGRNREARETYFDVYRRCRMERLRGKLREIGHKALMNAGLATKNLGEYRTAIQFYREILASDLVQQPLQEIQIRNLLGSLLNRLGESDEADAELNRALKLALRYEEHSLEADVRLNLAVLAFHRNQPEQVTENLERSRELAGDDPERRLRVEINMGTLLWDMGDTARSWIFFDKAQDFARRQPLERYLPLILANQARIRSQEGIASEAVSLAEEALELNDTLQLEDAWVREACKEVLDTHQAETEDHFRLAEVLIKSHEMVAVSAEMRRIIRDVDALASSDLPVLVLGETGTGKELVARALHNAGPRREAPFVPVNCPAIPETLFESTLFGHVRGAFTGADQDRKGLVELAGDGTIFLDEIGDLPLSIQPKLLRFLESGEFQRMGSGQNHYSDARIVSATNRDLAELMAQRQFRNDLIMRISAFRIELPPLARRREDIYFIAASLLDELNRRHSTRKAFSARALKLMNEYPFPGNVRELRNAVMRGFQIAEHEIEPADLGIQHVLSDDREIRRRLPARDAASTVSQGEEEDWVLKINRGQGLPNGMNLEGALHDLEKRIIVRALDFRRGDREKTAEDLGLSFRALKYKIAKYGIKSRKRRGVLPDSPEERESRP